MAVQPVGQKKCLILCQSLCLSHIVPQLSVNIRWINEWTNECVLVTEGTKTNETWSLPLRSSQSIEHRQQIKYWLCLLGSTFFYLETPFCLCLATVHTHTRMEEQAMGKHASEEPRTGQRPAHHLPTLGEAASSWEGGRQERPIRAVGAEAQLLRRTLRDPSEKQAQNHWHIIPSGSACTDCRNSSKAARSPPPRKAAAWAERCRADTRVCFCVFKEMRRSPWF